MTPSPASPTRTFYRRPLPESCIAFSSETGKRLFKEALFGSSPSNYLEVYFPLAEQFTTQAEPAYCGLSTLAMVFNALKIDPNRLWKGPWRWYTEEHFDCCTPLSVAKKSGIDFSEFICLAKCNGAETFSQRANARLTMDTFRDIVKRTCQSSTEILVLNYSRKTLGQTGDGHFSPIGGYHEREDMVLILDVARFKYPPYWIPLPMAFEAMQGLDSTTEQPRGLITIKANANTHLTPGILQIKVKDSMFAVSGEFIRLFHQEIPKAVKKWKIASMEQTFCGFVQVLVKFLVDSPVFVVQPIIPESFMCDEHRKELETVFDLVMSSQLYHAMQNWTTHDTLCLDYAPEVLDQAQECTYNCIFTCFSICALPKDCLTSICRDPDMQTFVDQLEMNDLSLDQNPLTESIAYFARQIQSMMDLNTVAEISSCQSNSCSSERVLNALSDNSFARCARGQEHS